MKSKKQEILSKLIYLYENDKEFVENLTQYVSINNIINKFDEVKKNRLKEKIDSIEGFSYILNSTSEGSKEFEIIYNIDPKNIGFIELDRNIKSTMFDTKEYKHLNDKNHYRIRMLISTRSKILKGKEIVTYVDSSIYLEDLHKGIVPYQILAYTVDARKNISKSNIQIYTEEKLVSDTIEEISDGYDYFHILNNENNRLYSIVIPKEFKMKLLEIKLLISEYFYKLYD